MTDIDLVYAPVVVSPPGDTIADLLDERGMSQAELARRLGTAPKVVNEIIRGKAPVSAAMAVDLERVLGAPATFWTTRQAQFDAANAAAAGREQMKAWLPWLQRFPRPWLREWAGMPTTQTRVQEVEWLLRYFAVANPDEWAVNYGSAQVAYRRSRVRRADEYAVASWLRLAEREAQKVECRPFDRDRLEAAIPQLRALTCLEPQEFAPAMTRICAGAGVALVFVAAVPRSQVNGVVKWLSPGKAMIGLSLLGRFEDRFWFTFFHELCHVLRHQKKLVFLDDAGGACDDADEAEADRFAAEVLIPHRKLANLSVVRGTREAVCAFADGLGVSPAIVVGRMQHEGWLPRSHLNGLKRRFVLKSDCQG
jgi:HTH-type transcriptional regulator/antitoxin HigA